MGAAILAWTLPYSGGSGASGITIQAGWPAGSQCRGKLLRDALPGIETSDAQGGFMSGVLLQNLELRFQRVFQLLLPGKQDDESCRGRNNKSQSRLVTLIYL